MRYVELPALLQKQQRVVSIDALRGLNMFCIMGFEGAMWRLLVGYWALMTFVQSRKLGPASRLGLRWQRG
jgi:hypothetical protein